MKEFRELCKKIFSKMYRILAHCIIQHGDVIRHFKAVSNVSNKNYLFLQAEQVNDCYKHFLYFVKEHDLIKQIELEPTVS